jgi:hypothetical protein
MYICNSALYINIVGPCFVVQTITIDRQAPKLEQPAQVIISNANNSRSSEYDCTSVPLRRHLSHVLIGLVSSEYLNKSEAAVIGTRTSDSTQSAAILTAVNASGAIAEEDSGQPRQLHRLHFILGRLHNLHEGRPEVLAHTL